jgi:uncharacterized protein YggE
VTETVITVQGTFSKLYPAERADATISVHIEAPARDAAFASATKASTKVRATIEKLPEAAISKWSSDRIQTWDEKPWNNEGAQLPLVFHARVGFTVRFSDFDALATWLEKVTAIDGVTVDALDWDLTDSSRTGATAEVRSRAVKDAVAKASVYAQSIGLGTVSATALADPGMLGVGVPAPSADLRMMKASADVSQLSLKPADIEIAATVDARFVAS